MKTPRQSYSRTAEIVYTCELSTCPVCDLGLVPWHYQTGLKTVQTLKGVRTIAQRPKRCAQEGCAGYTQVFPSAEWQQVAPLGCTYGYDVIAQIGWQRQTRRDIFADVHAMLTNLAVPVQISESQVRYLYHERYLPLLACHEREHLAELQALGHSLGLLLTLDGLAPEGGEPQLWWVRELRSGLTLRSGWLSTQEARSLANFLRPIADLGVPITAVLSDKQASLVLAVKEVFPHSQHQFCQSHYLDNAATPIAAADEQMKIALRVAVREAIGPLVRQEQAEIPGVLTVTGVLPSPLPPAPVDPPLAAAPLPAVPQPPPAPAPVDADTAERESIIQALQRRVRYLLTLKGRPPFCLAGIEMYAGLLVVAECLARLIAHQPEKRLLRLHAGLCQALQTVSADYHDICHAADWLESLADVLNPEGKPQRTGAHVQAEFEDCLRQIDADREQQSSPRLQDLARAIDTVSRSYLPGLFYCYDVPGLPRTNNACESGFRIVNCRILRTTGQKGATRRILQREGAWELLPRPSSLAETIRVFSRVPPKELAQERQRVRIHRDRFRLHTRSAQQAQRQLDQLERRWQAIPPVPGS